MQRQLARLREYCDRFGAVNVLFELWNLLGRRLRSARYAGALGHPAGLNIGEGTTFAGVGYIDIGSNFHCGLRNKIEAISAHGGRAYRPHLRIGHDVSLNDDVHIGCVAFVSIGNNVLMASKIYITDHNHGAYRGPSQASPNVAPNARPLDVPGQVVIEDNVWIGEMVSILPGSHIGRGSVIGANSVVNGIVPPYSIAVGAPARVVKSFDFGSNTWVSIKEKRAERQA